MEPLNIDPANSLNEESQAATILLQLLQQEQAQLIAADIDGLTELTQEKSKVIARMTALTVERHRALAAAGFEAKESGMQAWLEKSAAASALNSWTELLALARSAKELNRTNGMLINKHLMRNQNALNVLHGSQGGGNFYGPDGQSSVKTTMRGLVIG